jgi:phosphoribosylformylglycinamidine (FGAM) synthase-like amidotransferase family enzyme
MGEDAARIAPNLEAVAGIGLVTDADRLVVGIGQNVVAIDDFARDIVEAIETIMHGTLRQMQARATKQSLVVGTCNGWPTMMHHSMLAAARPKAD